MMQNNQVQKSLMHQNNQNLENSTAQIVHISTKSNALSISSSQVQQQ